jgi:hypothetical protein
MRTQKIESFSIASLVKSTVGTLDHSAPGLDDQRKRRHAATADPAKKVIVNHCRIQRARLQTDETCCENRMSVE